TEITFGDATFLIGPNNSGKSTVFKAIEYLLSAQKSIPSTDYYSVIDEETKETKPIVNTIVFEAEFRNLPVDANTWRGFKGRIFEYEKMSDNDSGLSVVYRKTYEMSKDVIIEFKSKTRVRKPEFETCTTANDLISKGLDENIVLELFPEREKKIGTSKAFLDKLEQLDEIWDIQNDDTWFQNPGGIPQNVLKKLPRYLLIPADTSIGEIDGGTSGVLGKTLNDLFEDVRTASDNYKEAQKFLDALSKELDPEDSKSEFGKMLNELNAVLSGVFPDSKIYAVTDLSDPNKALKPTFHIEMSSNVKTPVGQQGSGMVRAAAFGMLRFRQRWLSKREDEGIRPIIICFEEPEIYLHPSAANQMRDTIYDLSCENSQIVATTHSPFLIDLSRKPRQVLNSLKISAEGVIAYPFSVSDNFKTLQEDDKSNVKMLMKIDDYLARLFFAKHVVIVEGDTEDILIKESLRRLPRQKYLSILSDFEILKARGKATIVGLVKYLLSFGIVPIVVHDKDSGIAGAEKFNEVIANLLKDKRTPILMCECVENEVGYAIPSSEKPYKAFLETQKWGNEWASLPENWRLKLELIFADYI
ncbi:MAG TPA: AAA family ATPase, partial [Bacteroidota bacterium]|nr:AAA family ATPase [Bacteroidota bacterium]